MTGQGFLIALVAFIIVASLIDRYDEDHGTGFLWLFTIIIALGMAVRNSGQLSQGLGAVAAQMTGKGGTGGSQTIPVPPGDYGKAGK